MRPRYSEPLRQLSQNASEVILDIPLSPVLRGQPDRAQISCYAATVADEHAALATHHVAMPRHHRRRPCRRIVQTCQIRVRDEGLVIRKLVNNEELSCVLSLPSRAAVEPGNAQALREMLLRMP